MTLTKHAMIVTVLALSLAACNTVNGVGHDLRSAGQAISETAEEVRR